MCSTNKRDETSRGKPGPHCEKPQSLEFSAHPLLETRSPWGAARTCVLRLDNEPLRRLGKGNEAVFRWKLELFFPEVKFEFRVLALNKGENGDSELKSKLTTMK